VRIRREGFSPNTFAADALPDVGWQLPAPVVGGEVVIRSTSAIEPVAYLVRGAGAAAPYDTSADLLSVAGLGEGVHEVVPHFEGGIPGLTLRVGIQPGQSTPVALATDDIGGVTWELGPDVCADGRRLRLTRVETQSITTSDGTATSIRHYDAQIPPDPAPCRRTVAGLAPGQYQLIISGDGRVVARSEFSIQPGVLTSVPVESAGVRVGGTVTINGRPFREVVVAFFQGMPRPVAEFRPDAAGRYGGSLPETGAYVVRLSTESVRLLGQDRTVKIVEGQNLVDLSAEGGTLTLTLEGLDKAEDTKLDLLMFESKPRDGSWGIATNFVTDNPSLADNKIVLQGIGFADYVLYARQTSPGTPAKVSEVVTVAVREIQPDAAATLRFRTNAGRILLVDPEHRPVADAQRPQRSLPGPTASERFLQGRRSPSRHRASEPCAGSLRQM
jgi:hypothetical protein